MASVCEICGKNPWFGKSTKRMNVCTGCIKAGKVVKAGH